MRRRSLESRILVPIDETHKNKKELTKLFRHRVESPGDFRSHILQKQKAPCRESLIKEHNDRLKELLSDFSELTVDSTPSYWIRSDYDIKI